MLSPGKLHYDWLSQALRDVAVEVVHYPLGLSGVNELDDGGGSAIGHTECPHTDNPTVGRENIPYGGLITAVRQVANPDSVS